MSIEMDNPKSPLEKVDAAANLVSQMLLAHRMGDEQRFNKAHDRASELLFQLTQYLAELVWEEES